MPKPVWLAVLSACPKLSGLPVEEWALSSNAQWNAQCLLKTPIKASAAVPSDSGPAFDLVFLDVPAIQKIAVIKAIREAVPDAGLAAVKAMVDSPSGGVIQCATKAEADELAQARHRAGAKVEVRPTA